jgi:hypothetical protein
VKKSIEANADLSSNQFQIVKRTAGKAALCAVAGEAAFGVLQDDPAASGRACVVRVAGISKVVYGGTVSIDDALTTDANGKAVAIGAGGGRYLGRANVAGVLDDTGEVIMFGPAPGGYSGYAKKTIQLPLAQARELSSDEFQNLAAHGGILANDSTPLIEAVNPGTDQASRLNWAASNNDKIGWHRPSVRPRRGASYHAAYLVQDGRRDGHADLDVGGVFR